MDPSETHDPIEEIKRVSAYTIEPGTEGLITERRTLITAQHNGQVFVPGGQTSFMLRCGEYAFDGDGSYFQFVLKVQNPGTRCRLNPLGACALVDRVQIESANGLVLFNHLNYPQAVRLQQNVSPYTTENFRSNEDMEECASYYEQKRNDNFDGHYHPVQNLLPEQAQFLQGIANPTVGIRVQLHLWCTMLKQKRFLPAMLMGPLKVTITWAAYRDAFLEDAISSTPSSYSISEFAMVQNLVKFSASFTDKIEATIAARTEAGGLPMVQNDYWRTETVANSDISYQTIDLNKSAANATKIVTVMQPQELTQSSGFPHVDKLLFSPCGLQKYQWRIGGNFYPQQPVEVPPTAPHDYERNFMEANIGWKEPGARGGDQINGLNRVRFAPRIAVKDAGATQTSVCPGYIRIGPNNDTFYYEVFELLGVDHYMPSSANGAIVSAAGPPWLATRTAVVGPATCVQSFYPMHGAISLKTKVLSIPLPHGVWKWEYICNIIKVKATIPAYFDYSCCQSEKARTRGYTISGSINADGKVPGFTAGPDSETNDSGVGIRAITTDASIKIAVPGVVQLGGPIHPLLTSQVGKPLFSKVAIEVEETTGLLIFVLARSAACYSAWNRNGGASSVNLGYNMDDTTLASGQHYTSFAAGVDLTSFITSDGYLSKWLACPEIVPAIARCAATGLLSDGNDQDCGGNFLHTFGIRCCPSDGGTSVVPAAAAADMQNFLVKVQSFSPSEPSITTNWLGRGTSGINGDGVRQTDSCVAPVPWGGANNYAYPTIFNMTGVAGSAGAVIGAAPDRLTATLATGIDNFTQSASIAFQTGNPLANFGKGFGIWIRNSKSTVQFTAPDVASSVEVDLTKPYQNPNNMLDACVRIGPGAAPAQPGIGRSFPTSLCLPGVAALPWYDRTQDFQVGLCLQDAPGVMMSGRPTSLDAVPRLELTFNSNDVIFNGSRLSVTPDSLITAVVAKAGSQGPGGAVVGQGTDNAKSALLTQSARRIISFLYFSTVIMVQSGKTLSLRQ